MRISDWSSDVCSSDLTAVIFLHLLNLLGQLDPRLRMIPQCQGKTRETCCHCCDLIILSDQRLSKRAGARRLAPRVPKRTESGTTWIVLHDRLCRQSWLMVARGKNIHDRSEEHQSEL